MPDNKFTRTSTTGKFTTDSAMRGEFKAAAVSKKSPDTIAVSTKMASSEMTIVAIFDSKRGLGREKIEVPYNAEKSAERRGHWIANGLRASRADTGDSD